VSNGNCPICNNSAKHTKESFQKIWIVCHWCGKYTCDYSDALENVMSLNFETKRHIISGWVRNNQNENNAPSFYEATLKRDIKWIIETYPSTVPEKINLLILHYGKNSSYPGYNVSVSKEDFPISFSKNYDEFSYLLNSMVEMNFISVRSYGGSINSVIVCSDGWEKYEELKNSEPESIDSNQVFVAMDFGDKYKPIYRDGIKIALEKVGYDPLIMWEHMHNGKICEEILHQIQKSKFLVVDVTGGNQGAYFEAGYAQGQGKQVFWTCKKGEKEEKKGMHFDTRQFHHILWEDYADLEKQLVDRVRFNAGRGKSPNLD